MISIADIFEAARQQGKTPACIALNNGITPDLNMWPDLSDELDSASDSRKSVNLLGAGPDKAFIRDFSKSIADAIQFPASTAFMHMLGCVSTAMSHRFSVDYFGKELHSGLYVISAQPPSTGKSAVHDMFQKPISNAYMELNKKNNVERNRIKLRISKLNEQIKQAGTAISDSEMDGITMSIQQEYDKLELFPSFSYDVSDATPEAIGVIASNAAGNFTLVSDEATVINTALGMSYGSEGRMANNETILKGWDGGRVSTARVGRESKPFDSRGSISVIAQAETIRSILIAGERGNGITERFLFINEPSMLGGRAFIDDNGIPIQFDIDRSLVADYAKMIHSMVIGDSVVLKMSKRALGILSMEKQLIEPKLADNQEFGSSLLRGVMGKMDKQVCKIAAVLHGIQEWGPGGSQKKEISDETTMWAIDLFKILSTTFVGAATSEGYAGINVELKKVFDKVVKLSNRGRPVQISNVYQNLRNTVPFKGSDGFNFKLKDILLPELERMGLVVVIGKKIFVNPKAF